MHKFGDVLENRTKSMLSALRLAVPGALVVVGLSIAAPSRARVQKQTQTQNTVAPALPKFEYEVASIKPDLSDHTSAGWMISPDGLTVTNFSLAGLIENAYGIRKYQLSGAPDWLNSETYDVDAKMDAATAEALKKLNSEDQNLEQQQMLQTLLADRFKLKIHRETKEGPVYLLAIGKNGFKLQEARPGATYPNGAGPGSMSSSSNWLAETMMFQAMPISGLARNLEARLGRPVLDKTGLTGNYDFTLKFAIDRSQSQSVTGDSPNAQPAPGQIDPDAPFLLEAIQKQLGLKLEPGKGPVEVIVIDHVERPSGN
jgi:uncharacterized protein (TIGR03435 family)